jgi:hypothetical protein
VTPKEFQAYAESLNVETRFPSLDGLNYAKYFDAKDRLEFLNAFKKDLALTSNSLVTLNLPPDREEYMVITRSYLRTRPALDLMC